MTETAGLLWSFVAYFTRCLLRAANKTIKPLIDYYQLLLFLFESDFNLLFSKALADRENSICDLCHATHLAGCNVALETTQK